jgi:uncharacterized membrane protein YbhN (UPF0104 family)
MKKKYQNAFFLFGLTVLLIMLTQLDYAEVWVNVCHAGYWFVAVVVLWFFLYLFNTAAWKIIIGSLDGKDAKKVSFWWLYKVTVSGFALNYATPGGLMGGEPYRIMSLAPRIGTERATASVLLYVMTHIYSHFWFWLLSCVLYVATQPLDLFMALLLLAVVAFCLLAIWFFLKGYKRGIAVSGMRLLSHIPLLKRRARRFFDNHAEQLSDIDHKIAALHNQNPRTFHCAVLLELVCRIVSALEIFFILLVIMPSVNYLQCILILAFTSLFANMLWFIPLQLGGREGGFLMSVSGLGMTAQAGIFVALLVRLRELIWTAIGLLLIKVKK